MFSVYLRGAQFGKMITCTRLPVLDFVHNSVENMCESLWMLSVCLNYYKFYFDDFDDRLLVRVVKSVSVKLVKICSNM